MLPKLCQVLQAGWQWSLGEHSPYKQWEYQNRPWHTVVPRELHQSYLNYNHNFGTALFAVMKVSWDSSIGIVIRLQASQSSNHNLITGRGNRLFTSANNPKQIWGKLSFLLIGYCGLFTQQQSSQHSVDCWPPSSIEVKNECSYTSTPSYTFMVCEGQLHIYFLLLQIYDPAADFTFVLPVSSQQLTWFWCATVYRWGLALWRNSSMKVDNIFFLLWWCSLTTCCIWHGQALTGDSGKAVQSLSMVDPHYGPQFLIQILSDLTL